MAEPFLLIVKYGNREFRLDAELRMLGYTHKIAVMVDTTEVLFEPDEERNYRAVVAADTDQRKLPDAGLLQAIAEELEANLK
jgi:hypothetical protein